ncbi:MULTISPECIES: spermidine synthase [Thiomicrorhabdus]|uniref:Spermidine synthase n=1 Tax=Thiomicrorhabdus heinhorstiae TaxID=2748010 RepID=A0ABS0BYK5_9GAMM|nr:MULTISPECIES: hypothetical protein [Thiomicrorhabdus]MBF6058878.1 hypothetical protein [Thiomicrorhabdus heinhorstiae]
MKYDGIIIHSARDQYGLIEVVENRSTRKLYFDTPIEQSCIYRNAPMTLNFEYQQKIVSLVNEHFQNRKQPKNYRVLMLGMGGGSMAHNLYHSLPNVQITIVELRQIVIDAAYRYFQLPNVPEIESIQADAIEYILELALDCDDNPLFQYDAILVDIFDAEGLPPELSAPLFHDAIADCVKKKGRLIFNLWNRIEPGREHEHTEDTADILRHWQQNVENIRSQERYLMKSTSNLILNIDF